MHAHHFWWAITSPAFDNSDILFSSNPPFLIVGLDRLMAAVADPGGVEGVATPPSLYNDLKFLNDPKWPVLL